MYQRVLYSIAIILGYDMGHQPKKPMICVGNMITVRIHSCVAFGLLIFLICVGCTDQESADQKTATQSGDVQTGTPTRVPNPTASSAPSPTQFSESTSLPTPSPTSVSTATMLPVPTRTPALPEPTRTPTHAEFSLILDEDTIWLEAFNTFTPPERDCIRGSLDPQQLQSMLERRIVSDAMDGGEWEAPLFSCLLPERANELLVNTIIVGFESDGLPVSDDGRQCLMTWVAGVDVARLIATVDSDHEVSEKAAYDIFACFRDYFAEVAVEAMALGSDSELGRSERACLRQVLDRLPDHVFTGFFLGTSTEDPTALWNALEECAPGIIRDIPQEFVEEVTRELWWSEPDAGKFTMVDTMTDQSCGLLNTGKIVCWGTGSERKKAPTAGYFVSVSVGEWHNCALTEEGEAVCWGIDEYGQVAPPEARFSYVNVGWLHTCGIKAEDGKVLCWGENWAGQTTPIPDGVYSSVSSGWDFSCGLRVDGRVICWGSDEFGQSSPPDAEFTLVSAGEAHACGVTVDGPVLCWGYGEKNTDPPPWHFQSVSAGVRHNCGIRGGGQVVCWGENSDGESAPPPGARFSSVNAGWSRTCGVSLDGRVACWGYGGPFE